MDTDFDTYEAVGESHAKLVAVKKMSKDIRIAGMLLTDEQVRFLVDSYYQMQDDRMRSASQARSLEKENEPNEVLRWFEEQSVTMEHQIKTAMNQYTMNHPMGEWMRSVKGIGPILAGGILAHIDITRAQTAGAIWKYAGLAPGQKRKKGEKLDYNPMMKVLAWKIGESFVKVSGSDTAFYGRQYVQQKDKYQRKNEAGGFSETAAAVLAAKKFDKTTEAFKHYSSGKLPPAHIHSMAKRWAVKLFLAHLFEIWYAKHHGVPAPLPYPIAHMGHAHRIEP